ncbi:MAG TPA: beta-ketoacyl-ACP synthase III [Candidatus Sumerlaeota bacterium]|nr:beta-ketoacyl-ACP synthase III [Candidatus Sumerlaeota bacterium]
MNSEKQVGIIGLGMYVPDQVVTNHDMEKIVETSDEWIVTRSGIKERRKAAPDQATSDLDAEAGRRALENAGIGPEDLDGIICATFTPDHLCPSTACIVQDKLGAKNAFAFDISAACSGFVYGLNVAKGLILSETYRTIMVIGGETMSRFTDYQDRGTCVLFGDGAGCAILQADAPRGRLLHSYMGSDGSMARHIIIPAGGSRRPPSKETLEERKHFIYMEGNEVFKFAVRILAHSVEEALKRSGHKVEEVSLIIPHQANYRILESAAKKMGLPPEKMYNNIAYYGNTSAGTVPIALTEAVQKGAVKPGDVIALVAFGGGMTWGSIVIEW